jgi:hypothetical protein
MQNVTNIKSISYLKSHAAQISEDLEINSNPFFITQNGDARMVIESVKRYQEKESLIGKSVLFHSRYSPKLADFVPSFWYGW